MNEVVRSHEPSLGKERLFNYSEMIGFQTRVLLKDQKYIDPSIKTPQDLSAAPIGAFETRNYLPFENTSVYDRTEYWKSDQRQTLKAEEKLEVWAEGMVNVFKMESNKEFLEPIAKVLKHTGINYEEINKDEAMKLYERYFSKKQSVKQFVADILEATADKSFSSSEISAIKWLSNIFGEKSAEIVAQLLDGELKLKTGDNSVEKALEMGRANNLTADEIDLLNHIKNHGNFRLDSSSTRRDDNGQNDEEENQTEEESQNEDENIGDNQDKKGTEDKNKGPLPMEKYKGEIKEALKDSRVKKLIIAAGTGTGKTTKVPQYIREVMHENGMRDKLVITQPRRLPTESLAERVAGELDIELGEEVGFQHGKKRAVSRNTRENFMVEGTLLRKLSQDPLLSEYSYAMIDEWHERHKHTDILVGLLLDAQRLRDEMIARGENIRPLKLIFTSATFDLPKMENYLGEDTKTIEVPGKNYKVEELFEEEGKGEVSLEDMAKIYAPKYAKEMIKPGRNLIIFMPGDRTVSTTYNEIKRWLEEEDIKDVVVKKLIGSQSPEEQNDAKTVKEGVSSIIVASPLAETSLTIPNVDVISSGYVNLPILDKTNGLYFLEEVKHSKKGLEQQRGRAGRTGPGTFRFLGTKSDYENRPEHHPSEIARTDLTQEILLLKTMDKNISDLRLIDNPPESNVERALRRLKKLGALDQNGKVTPEGKIMAGIPADPHLAKMLLEAGKGKFVKKMSEIICLHAAAKSLFERPDQDHPEEEIERSRNSFKVEGSDYLSLLNLWDKYKETPEDKREDWAKKNHIRYSNLQQVEEAVKDLLDKLSNNFDLSKDIDNVSTEEIEKAIVRGLRDNLLQRMRNGAYVNFYEASHSPPCGIDRVSAVDKDKGDSRNRTTYEYVVYSHNNMRQRNRRTIYMQGCQAVRKKEWLDEEVAA